MAEDPEQVEAVVYTAIEPGSRKARQSIEGTPMGIVATHGTRAKDTEL